MKTTDFELFNPQLCGRCGIRTRKLPVLRHLCAECLAEEYPDGGDDKNLLDREQDAGGTSQDALFLAERPTRMPSGWAARRQNTAGGNSQ